MHSFPIGDLLALAGRLTILHHVPGRLRIRVSKDILDHAPTTSLADIRGLVETITGVRTLRLSPATLSAVIDYDPGVIAPRLWQSLIDGPEESARDAFQTLTGSAEAAKE